MIRHIILFIIDKLGINNLFRYLNRNKIVIVQYHGICEDTFTLLQGYDERHIPQSVFRKQLNYLKKWGYKFATISEVVDILKGDKKIPEEIITLTFDDGFKNVIEKAYPIMKEYNAKGCIYIVSSLIGTNNLLWTDYVETVVRNSPQGIFNFNLKDEILSYKLDTKESYQSAMRDIKNKLRSVSNQDRILSLRQFDNRELDEIPKEFCFLSWEQLRSLDKDIFEIGSHSKTHPNLDRLEDGELGEEIEGSKKDIERETNNTILHFNYPAGAFNERVVDSVKECGYLSAVSTTQGFNDQNTNMFKLRRIGVNRNFTIFKANISGFSLFLGNISHTISISIAHIRRLF